MMRCYCALWISAIPLPCTILWSCQWHNKNRKWQLIHLSLSCVFYVLHLCAEIMTRCVVYDSTCYSEHMLSFQEPKKIKSKYTIRWWHLLALIQFDKRCFSTKNGINVLSVGNATKKMLHATDLSTLFIFANSTVRSGELNSLKIIACFLCNLTGIWCCFPFSSSDFGVFFFHLLNLCNTNLLMLNQHRVVEMKNESFFFMLNNKTRKRRKE